MTRMAESFAPVLAAELPALPPEIQLPSAPPLNGAPDANLPTLLAIAALVVVPLILAFTFSRRRRRKRMPHRPRNPTLAETGGLPPPRPPQ